MRSTDAVHTKTCGGENKGSPISKAPVKRAQAIVPSVFSERGPCSDPVFPRRAGRMTSSHPGCPHQWCRLHPEPHQSPIRIKASERASMRFAPAPGTTCPRQPSVPGRVHRIEAQDVWLPAYWRQPHHGSQPRRLSPHARGAGNTGVKLGLIGSAGSPPNPSASSQLHPSPGHGQPKARDNSNGTCSRNMW